MNDTAPRDAAAHDAAPHDNPHLSTRVERWGASDADAVIAVLALHGRGQSPDIMRAQSERLDDVAPGSAPGSAPIAWFAPAASDDSWYPQRFMSPVESNEPWLGYALDAVDAALDGIRAAGFTDDAIVLFGFSQGACLLSEYLLRRPAVFGATVIMTGGFIGPDDLREVHGDLDDMPVLIDIGDSDEWVPAHRARATAEALELLGADVAFHVYPSSTHEITAESLHRIRSVFALVADEVRVS